MIKFLLLALLAARRRHGYELKAAFEELFGGTWPLNAGQVYMTLQRLEEDGLVTSEVVEQELLPDRRVYSLTEDGRTELKGWMTETSDGPIRIRDEMVAKVLTSIVTGAARPLDLVWSQRTSRLRSIAELRARKNDPALTIATKLLLEAAILRTEADLRWLDLVEERLGEGVR